MRGCYFGICFRLKRLVLLHCCFVVFVVPVVLDLFACVGGVGSDGTLELCVVWCLVCCLLGVWFCCLCIVCLFECLLFVFLVCCLV